MRGMGKGLKGPLQVTAKDVVGIMTLFLGQNAHIVQWMMFLLGMLMLEYANQGLVWIMNMVVAVHNMGMLIVTGLGDLTWDMVAATELLFRVRIHMGFIVVGREWVMEEVVMVVAKVGCIHQAMVGIICLVDLMLVVALTPRCILVVAWVAVATWAVAVLDQVLAHIIEMLVDKEAAVGCGLIEGYAVLCIQIWTSLL
jgi:hypothetical protein